MTLLIIWFLLTVAAIGATLWWLVGLLRRHTSSTPVKVVAAVGMATVLPLLAGGVVGVVMALRATGGEALHPPQKARAFAEGISMAMNCTAAGVLLFIPLTIAVRFLHRGKRDAPSP